MTSAFVKFDAKQDKFKKTYTFLSKQKNLPRGQVSSKIRPSLQANLQDLLRANTSPD
jgi:hypothetical protein